MSATLSVVVPAYNVESYIEPALDSLLNQHDPPDEILVIDDGSTDGTPEKLERYKSYDFIQVIRTENQGLGPARNLGLVTSKSEFVYFFDSDDLLEPDFVTQMKKIIVEHSPDVILFSGESFVESGYHSDFSPDYLRGFSAVYEKGVSAIRSLYDSGGLKASACLYLSRRELWRESCLSFPAIIHEDEAVCLPLLARAGCTVVDNRVYFRRRVRANSIMTSMPTRRHVKSAAELVRTLSLEFRSGVDASPENYLVWKERIYNQVSRYVRYADYCRERLDTSLVFSVYITTRRPRVLALAFYTLLPLVLRILIRKYRSDGKA
jgi:glycosyltransferase involved in cell wall biosynthesis